MSYKGISFPFRLNKRGGIAMSGTSLDSVPHIEESITQILHTHRYERLMEHSIYSGVKTSLFDPNDESLQVLLKHDIVEALTRCEPRISIDESGVSFIPIHDDVRGDILLTTLDYTVIDYGLKKSTTIDMGGIE